MFLGNNTMDSMFLGATGVDRVALGATIVWESIAWIEGPPLVYDVNSMDEFTAHTNTEVVGGVLIAGDIDTTNIIDVAIADSFDTGIKVVDGDILSVDGSELIASGVTDVAGLVNNTDPFNDGSLVYKLEMEDAIATVGANPSNTGVTFGSGKFNNAGIFNGSAYFLSANNLISAKLIIPSLL